MSRFDNITADIYSIEYSCGGDDFDDSDKQLCHIMQLAAWAKQCVAEDDLDSAEEWIRIAQAQLEAWFSRNRDDGALFGDDRENDSYEE